MSNGSIQKIWTKLWLLMHHACVLYFNFAIKIFKALKLHCSSFVLYILYYSSESANQLTILKKCEVKSTTFASE